MSNTNHGKYLGVSNNTAHTAEAPAHPHSQKPYIYRNRLKDRFPLGIRIIVALIRNLLYLIRYYQVLNRNNTSIIFKISYIFLEEAF